MSRMDERIENLQKQFSSDRQQLRNKALAIMGELDLGVFGGMVVSEFESRLRKLSDDKCARLLAILRD